MTDIYLTLPWAPAYGSYYRQTQRGKFVTPKGDAFRAALAYEVSCQNALNLNLGSNLEFSVIFYPPDNRVRDFDNHLKSLQDALTEAHVWKDDGAVDQLHVYRGVIVNKGKILVKICKGSMLLPLLPVYTDIWGLIEGPAE